MRASSRVARASQLLAWVLPLAILAATTAAAARLELPIASREAGKGVVRRGHALLKRALARRADIDLVTSDGSLSLARLLELRRQQRRELQQWWNGSLPANSSWTVVPDDARLQTLLPTPLQAPSFSELDSPTGEAYYWNISGYYKGGYSARELAPTARNGTRSSSRHRRAKPNSTEPTVQALRGNFPWLDTAGGTVDLEISENHDVSTNLSMVQGSLFLKSKAQSRSLWSSDVIAGASVRFDLTGVHYLYNGGLLLNALPAESTQVPDTRAVLGMLPANLLPGNGSLSRPPSETASSVLNITWHAINETMSDEIGRLRELVGDKDPTEPVSTAVDARITHNCTDMHLYLRLRPATPAHPSPRQVENLRDYERELFHTTGSSPLGLLGQRAPHLYIDHAVFFSARCNLVLDVGQPQARGLEGLRYITHRRKIMRAALCLALVTFVQLRLTMLMMRRARTASARVKIDWRTLLLQTVADMYTSMLCAISAVVWRNETNLLLAAVSYVVGCHFVGGEYQFLIFVVHDSQNDPLNARPAAPAPATVAATPLVPEGPAAEPPTTQTGQADTTPNPPAADAPTDPADEAALARRQRRQRYVGIFLVFFLLMFQPILFYSILGPVLYSFWIPQIIRNIKRGSRRPYPRTYIIGMTACRFMLPLYFWQCPNNIFFWETTPLVWILIGYVWAQALILLLQDELGPAFFLPARFQPEGPPSWDWHPPLSVLRKHIRQASDKAGARPLGGKLEDEARAQAEAEGRMSSAHQHGRGAQYEIEIGDCAICLSEIEPLRWDWRDEEEEDGDGEANSEDGGQSTDGDEYAYVAVDGGADAAEPSTSGGARSSRSRRESTESSQPHQPRRRRHLRTGSLLTSWASSAVRVGRRVGRAISAAREHGGRGRSSAAAASAALGGGRTDIMVAPCHHIFHTECLERWLQYKSECPSCRMPLPPA